MKFKTLKRWLRTSAFADNPLYHTLRFKMREKACETIIYEYMPDIQMEELGGVKKLMLEAVVKYHWDFREFFYFDYQHLTDEERKNFVPEYEKNVFCSKVNDPEQAAIFYNKWKTYCKFKKYYRRDAVCLDSLEDLKKSQVKEFVGKHSSFIMKPVEAACGRGIILVKKDNSKDAMMRLTEIMTYSPTKYIMEELIYQVNEMASLNNSSVNTVRISTINFGDSIGITHPFMRTGRSGSVVDNGGAGGIISVINQEKGRVITACDEHLHWYDIHPDSKHPLVGFQVPRWQEAIETAKELASILPDVKYVGWDLALTDRGWVMVEGNDFGAFVGFQLPIRTGFRPEFEEIKKRLKVK